MLDEFDLELIFAYIIEGFILVRKTKKLFLKLRWIASAVKGLYCI